MLSWVSDFLAAGQVLVQVVEAVNKEKGKKEKLALRGAFGVLRFDEETIDFLARGESIEEGHAAIFLRDTEERVGAAIATVGKYLSKRDVAHHFREVGRHLIAGKTRIRDEIRVALVYNSRPELVAQIRQFNSLLDDLDLRLLGPEL